MVKLSFTTSTEPCSSTLEPSIVMVPVRLANVSVVVVLVVQLPETVVDRVVVVETGPTTVSFADTVEVVEPEHCLCAEQVCSVKLVEGIATE
jgi:hypothetical protein